MCTSVHLLLFYIAVWPARILPTIALAPSRGLHGSAPLLGSCNPLHPPEIRLSIFEISPIEPRCWRVASTLLTQSSDSIVQPIPPASIQREYNMPAESLYEDGEVAPRGTRAPGSESDDDGLGQKRKHKKKVRREGRT